MSRTAHVAAVSINQTVGDWSGNRQRILEAIAACRAKGARLVCFPEMSIPGYSLGDRLQMEGTLTRSAEQVHHIRPRRHHFWITGGIFGSPSWSINGSVANVGVRL